MPGQSKDEGARLLERLSKMGLSGVEGLEDLCANIKGLEDAARTLCTGCVRKQEWVPTDCDGCLVKRTWMVLTRYIK